jgi:endonuclease III
MPRYTTRLSLANASVKLETAELALPSTAADTTPKRLQCKRESTTSPYLRRAVPVQLDDDGVPLPLGMRCHLIQETLCHDLYALVVQAILWNQTKGIMARPVLLAILDRYPNVETLVRADLVELTAIIQPIG